MQMLFYEIADLVRCNDVTLPREFVLFGEALVAVAGVMGLWLVIAIVRSGKLA